MERESFASSKVILHRCLKTKLEADMKIPFVSPNSFILSTTKFSGLSDKSITIKEWNVNHILFIVDSNYMEMIFDKLQ